MKLLWTPVAWAEYEYWQAHDLKVVARINDMLRDLKRTPFSGLGKPEPLKGDLAGFWSRRISGEHRLVYRVIGKNEAQHVEIIKCRFHYRD